MGRKKYDNYFKYRIIETFCNGKNSTEIEKEFGVKDTTVMKWVRKFISDGP